MSLPSPSKFAVERPLDASPPGSPARLARALEERGKPAAARAPGAYVLAGDVGGTNSRLVLYRVGAAVGAAPAFRATYKNADFASFAALLRAFLAEARAGRVAAGCVAVAGPVRDDRVRFTNLDWVVDARELETACGIARVSLVNDFVANGFGCASLDARDSAHLAGPPPTPGAPLACVGAGTGLGEVFATASRDGRYVAWPSEGGHGGFSARTAEDRELLAFLSAKFGGRVSTERVVSGPGLVDVYDFFANKYPAEVDAADDARIRADPEGARVVARSEAGACARALDCVLAAYGEELGRAAVTFCPFGGLYVAGGIALKNLDAIRRPDGALLAAYRDRGRVAAVLDRVPLRVVTVDDLGLRGAHYVARALLDAAADDAPPPPTRPRLALAAAAVAGLLLLLLRRRA